MAGFGRTEGAAPARRCVSSLRVAVDHAYTVVYAGRSCEEENSSGLDQTGLLVIITCQKEGCLFLQEDGGPVKCASSVEQL